METAGLYFPESLAGESSTPAQQCVPFAAWEFESFYFSARLVFFLLRLQGTVLHVGSCSP